VLLANRFDDTFENAIVDRVVHEQPAGGSARLARPREVHAANRTRDRLVEIGVRIHDQRILAAELEQHRLQRIGGRAHDRLFRSERCRSA
jgi:hypothetical protein